MPIRNSNDIEMALIISGPYFLLDVMTTAVCLNTFVKSNYAEKGSPTKMKKPLITSRPFFLLDAIITQLSPSLTGASGSVAEGEENRVQLDLGINFVDSQDTTSINGKKLWQLSVWTSRDKRGEAAKVGFVEQAFSTAQENTPLLKRSPFRFRYINYPMDLTGERCSDVKFICVRLAQGEKPNPDFFFSAEPDDEVLKECIEAPACHGKCVL